MSLGPEGAQVLDEAVDEQFAKEATKVLLRLDSPSISPSNDELVEQAKEALHDPGFSRLFNEFLDAEKEGSPVDYSKKAYELKKYILNSHNQVKIAAFIATCITVGVCTGGAGLVPLFAGKALNELVDKIGIALRDRSLAKNKSFLYKEYFPKMLIDLNKELEDVPKEGSLSLEILRARFYFSKKEKDEEIQRQKDEIQSKIKLSILKQVKHHTKDSLDKFQSSILLTLGRPDIYSPILDINQDLAIEKSFAEYVRDMANFAIEIELPKTTLSSSNLMNLTQQTIPSVNAFAESVMLSCVPPSKKIQKLKKLKKEYDRFSSERLKLSEIVLLHEITNPNSAQTLDDLAKEKDNFEKLLENPKFADIAYTFVSDYIKNTFKRKFADVPANALKKHLDAYGLAFIHSPQKLDMYLNPNNIKKTWKTLKSFEEHFSSHPDFARHVSIAKFHGDALLNLALDTWRLNWESIISMSSSAGVSLGIDIAEKIANRALKHLDQEKISEVLNNIDGDIFSQIKSKLSILDDKSLEVQLESCANILGRQKVIKDIAEDILGRELSLNEQLSQVVKEIKILREEMSTKSDHNEVNEIMKKIVKKLEKANGIKKELDEFVNKRNKSALLVMYYQTILAVVKERTEKRLRNIEKIINSSEDLAKNQFQIKPDSSENFKKLLRFRDDGLKSCFKIFHDEQSPLRPLYARDYSYLEKLNTVVKDLEKFKKLFNAEFSQLKNNLDDSEKSSIQKLIARTEQESVFAKKLLQLYEAYHEALKNNRAMVYSSSSKRPWDYDETRKSHQLFMEASDKYLKGCADLFNKNPLMRFVFKEIDEHIALNIEIQAQRSAQALLQAAQRMSSKVKHSAGLLKAAIGKELEAANAQLAYSKAHENFIEAEGELLKRTAMLEKAAIDLATEYSPSSTEILRHALKIIQDSNDRSLKRKEAIILERAKVQKKKEEAQDAVEKALKAGEKVVEKISKFEDAQSEDAEKELNQALSELIQAQENEMLKEEESSDAEFILIQLEDVARSENIFKKLSSEGASKELTPKAMIRAQARCIAASERFEEALNHKKIAQESESRAQETLSLAEHVLKMAKVHCDFIKKSYAIAKEQQAIWEEEVAQLKKADPQSRQEIQDRIQELNAAIENLQLSKKSVAIDGAKDAINQAEQAQTKAMKMFESANKKHNVIKKRLKFAEAIKEQSEKDFQGEKEKWEKQKEPTLPIIHQYGVGKNQQKVELCQSVAREPEVGVLAPERPVSQEKPVPPSEIEQEQVLESNQGSIISSKAKPKR